MEDLLKKFAEEEYSFIYNDSASVKSLLEGLEMTEDEFYDNMDEFVKEACEDFCNNEYIIQLIHETMDETLRNVLMWHLKSKI